MRRSGRSEEDLSMELKSANKDLKTKIEELEGEIKRAGHLGQS
jgi:hypothetical protein